MLKPTIDLRPEASRFSWVVDGCRRGPSDLFDIPIYADRDCVVLPSIGSMVPGWSLVVPRQSARNLASLKTDERRALIPAKDFVATTLHTFGGEVFEFEHGPAQLGSKTGCGVDQAHLHLVPMTFDLGEAVWAVHGGQRFQADQADPWSLIELDRDYWLVRSRRTGAGLIVYPQEPVSQGIRRVIASKLGLEGWDYRQDQFGENALKTRRAAARSAEWAG
ncbi:MAG: HIT domain-containing protein [Caulobacteraceae bacterium]